MTVLIIHRCQGLRIRLRLDRLFEPNVRKSFVVNERLNRSFVESFSHGNTYL